MKRENSLDLMKCIEAIYVACNATTRASQLDIIHKLGRDTRLLREVPTPDEFVCAAFMCASAKTPEQKARVAWRLSDHVWRCMGDGFALADCRALNDHVRDLNTANKWPWVDDLWSREEIAEIRASYGMPAA